MEIENGDEKRGMKMSISLKIIFIVSLLGTINNLGTVSAATPDRFARQEQQEQARERIERHDDRREHAQIRIAEKPEDEMDRAMQNTSAFYVDEIILENGLDDVSFLDGITETYEGQKFSIEDIHSLVSVMNRKLLDKGYVTSRVIIPEHSSSSCLSLFMRIHHNP